MSTEELQQLLAEQQRMTAEELSEEEGEDQQSVQQISCSEIKEILKKWTELQIFVENTHPDSEKANRCIHLLNFLKPNDIYKCRTAALTSRRYILNIYSTNIHTEYFKHAA